MRKLNSILKILPIGAAALIACGFINLNIYYQSFNIEIIRFISTQEILTYFLNDLLGILYSLSGMIIVWIYFYEPKKDNVPYHKIKPNLLMYLTGIVTILMIIGLVIVLFTEQNYYSYVYYKGAAGLLPILILFTLIYNKWVMKISMLVPISLSFLLLSVIYAKHEVFRVKENYKYSRAKIILENEIIESDSTRYYIGNTNNFIFIFNATTNSSHIYKMEDLKELTLQPHLE